jgi:hypothetical protein
MTYFWDFVDKFCEIFPYLLFSSITIITVVLIYIFRKQIKRILLLLLNLTKKSYLFFIKKLDYIASKITSTIDNSFLFSIEHFKEKKREKIEKEAIRLENERTCPNCHYKTLQVDYCTSSIINLKHEIRHASRKNNSSTELLLVILLCCLCPPLLCIVFIALPIYLMCELAPKAPVRQQYVVKCSYCGYQEVR